MNQFVLDIEEMSHIFGPVPSRRLGRSLGIDVVPAKSCSFDCIYCESGPTTHLSVKRSDFADPALVLAELEEFFRRFPECVDFITFSSAGEPTLYLRLGELIGKIKEKHPGTPVAVLTNGSLLWDASVRRELLRADMVVPSLDAVTPSIFAALNKPHSSLSIERIIEGTRAFRREYTGRLHLEIMLVLGVNDSPEELSALAREAANIGADRIELNTVVRPPAHCAHGLSIEQMQRAASFFPGDKTEIIGVFGQKKSIAGGGDLGARIMETIERRPCTVCELADSLGVSEEDLKSESDRLRETSRLVTVEFHGRKFLCLPGRDPFHSVK